MTRIRVESRDLKALVRDLKEHEDGKDRIKGLRRGLKEAAKPLVPQVKEAIGQIPSKGLRPSSKARGYRSGKSLRSAMQRAVTLQVKFSGAANKVGVSIFMNPKKMPDGTKSLPAYFEKTPGYTDLVHPTFGRYKNLTYQNVPAQGYFTNTIEPIAKEAEKAVEQVVDQVIKDLES